ncbi:hypothetical protein KL867_19305 [Ruegeria litorea]|uniref:Uncharacterized protein n=1 Tax=Falsiruegeria litorea TaxID=1280831 RepID=A0ABS5WVQ2_9RHOB|nr:hypothetical protein [Falsiruegeria litorea]MBT3143217.1 hypothetical protein [Falsiruegeria litorea]
MARKHTHDVAPRETLDRMAFLMAFVLGVGGGLLLKVLGAHPLLTAGYAALILVLYAVAAWAGGRVKIEPETIGDNCYYLGFLFTLASLAYTLYQMSNPTTNSGRPVDIPEVISGFGVALSSTIFGVFLRVFLMQLRPDFVAKDREVRADINRAFMDFRKSMSGMLSQMKGYAAESVQLASERDERLRSSTEKFTEDHQESLKASAELLSKHMNEAFSAAAKTAVEDISKAVAENNKAQQTQMAETLTELENLKARLSKQEAESFEEIQQRRKRLLAELEVAEKQIQAHNEAMDQYIKITRRSADAMTKRILPAIDSLEEKIKNMPPVQDAPYFAENEVKKTPEPQVEKFVVPEPHKRQPWIKRREGSE